jgi:hypothetical protein
VLALPLAPEMAFGHSVKCLAGLANSCKSLNKDVKMMMILFEFVICFYHGGGGGDAHYNKVRSLDEVPKKKIIS